MRNRISWLCVVAALAAVGCASIDSRDVTYGATRRVGVASTTCVPIRGTTVDNVLFVPPHELGFMPTAAFSMWYAHPVADHFEIRFLLDKGTYDLNFPDSWPADEAATWSFTSITTLLCVGNHWGRFGAYYRAGLGYQTNELEWTRYTSSASPWICLNIDFGLSIIATENWDIEMGLGYRSGFALYQLDNTEHDQVLDALTLKLGLQYLY